MALSHTFDDLSLYSRLITPHAFDGVFNVGWIDVRADFKKGPALPATVEKLQAIACGSAVVRALVKTRRSRPECPVCGPLSLPCEDRSLPEAELWVRGDNRVYASPISIIHYADVHGYEPPGEYVKSVAEFDLEKEFNAQALYERKLVECGWFASQYETDAP